MVKKRFGKLTKILKILFPSLSPKGSWVLGPVSWVQDHGSHFPSLGCWVLVPGSWVPNLGSWVPDPVSWVLAPASWVLGRGYQLLILDYVLKGTTFPQVFPKKSTFGVFKQTSFSWLVHCMIFAWANKITEKIYIIHEKSCYYLEILIFEK